jgi:hypothetical protein
VRVQVGKGSAQARNHKVSIAKRRLGLALPWKLLGGVEVTLSFVSLVAAGCILLIEAQSEEAAKVPMPGLGPAMSVGLFLIGVALLRGYRWPQAVLAATLVILLANRWL